MDFREQPDPRIDREEVGVATLVEWTIADDYKVVVHQHVGCPKVSPIEIFNGYLRCSKCFNPLTPEAADYVGMDLGAYDEKTNSFKA